MTRFFYYVVFKPLSYLPLSVLYLFSDFAFLLVYRVTGYRKSVVIKNLKNSFPEKSYDELKTIRKAFYHHICDLIIEDIKLISIPKKEMLQRFVVENPEVFEKFYKEGRSIILSASHYNNWEFLAKALNFYSPHQAVSIFAPLKNKFFNDIISRSRAEYGMEILPKDMVPRFFLTNKDRLVMPIFGGDQSPTYTKNVHWGMFLNQETSFHLGTEIFAVKYNLPVVYIKVNKVKRGYYSCVLEVLHENPANTESGEITDLHAKCLENAIKENPPFWLWSHDRWKRKMTDEERGEMEKKSKDT